MTVSVVVPAYNAAATIRDTLESLLAQTSPDWRAIVVDDGSRDETAAIVDHYVQRDDRFTLVRRENGGESTARNAGLAEARGEWLLFLDADDWIAPTYLERMTAALAADPALGAVCCQSVRVAADGTHVADPYQPPAGDLFPTLAKRAAFPVHACVVRRALVEEAGRFDTSLVKSPDWDLWQRIARTGARWGSVPEVLAFYRMQPQSASLAAAQMLRDGLTVMRRGHSPDPRVTRPDPAHANGAPPAEMASQQLYLLTWCAGLMIGQRQSPLPLFDQVQKDPRPELYADAVAQILFEAVPLPECLTREAWESLWPRVERPTTEFLDALAAFVGAPSLGIDALVNLKRLVLNASPTWSPVLADATARAAANARQLAALEHRIRDYEARVAEYEERLAAYEARVVAYDQARAVQQQRAEIAESDRARGDEELQRSQAQSQRLRDQLAGAEAQIALLEQMRWLKFGRATGVLKVPPYTRKGETN